MQEALAQLIAAKLPKLASIDIDGVMFDYHEGYKRKWESCYDVQLEEVKPGSYYAHTRYGTPVLHGEERNKFHAHRDEEFWLTMKPLPGALAACHKLVQMGFTLISVSAAPHYSRELRHRNLLAAGFPIANVFTAPHVDERSPVSGKAELLNQIKPTMHIDDYLHYFDGMDPSIQRILLDTHPNDPESPNNDHGRELVHSIHSSLLDYVNSLE